MPTPTAIATQPSRAQLRQLRHAHAARVAQYDQQRHLSEQRIADAVSTGLSRREAEALKDHHLGVQIGDHSSM